MKNFKSLVPKLMTFHFLIILLIFFLETEGFSHRSSTVVSLIQLPFFTWPIWFFFLGKGWTRFLSITMAAVLCFVMMIGFLFKDENRLTRRRFITPFGQIHIVGQFDFDHSKELPDEINLERPMLFGFTKRIKGYIPKDNGIGEIHEFKVHENTFEIKGAWGSYKFIHDVP